MTAVYVPLSSNSTSLLDPRLTLSHEYVLPSLSLYITAWWLCLLHTIQLKRAKWSGHSFVFAPICWSVVALFRMHWSVQWRGGEGWASQALVRGSSSETHHSARWWVRGRCIIHCADAVGMRGSLLGPFNRGTYMACHPPGMDMAYDSTEHCNWRHVELDVRHHGSNWWSLNQWFICWWLLF